jgi:hypothetical protein
LLVRALLSSKNKVISHLTNKCKVMKTLALFCITFLAAVGCFAQQGTTAGYDPSQRRSGKPATQDEYIPGDPLPAKELSVPQSTGQTYGGTEMLQLARKDVNGIASTVSGVEMRPGSGDTPSIRGGGPEGTAYFVDGVRVYGALPIIGK